MKRHWQNTIKEVKELDRIVRNGGMVYLCHKYEKLSILKVVLSYKQSLLSSTFQTPFLASRW